MFSFITSFLSVFPFSSSKIISCFVCSSFPLAFAFSFFSCLPGSCLLLRRSSLILCPSYTSLAPLPSLPCLPNNLLTLSSAFRVFFYRFLPLCFFVLFIHFILSSSFLPSFSNFFIYFPCSLISFLSFTVFPFLAHFSFHLHLSNLHLPPLTFFFIDFECSLSRFVFLPLLQSLYFSFLIVSFNLYSSLVCLYHFLTL